MNGSNGPPYLLAQRQLMGSVKQFHLCYNEALNEKWRSVKQSNKDKELIKSNEEITSIN